MLLEEVGRHTSPVPLRLAAAGPRRAGHRGDRAHAAAAPWSTARPPRPWPGRDGPTPSGGDGTGDRVTPHRATRSLRGGGRGRRGRGRRARRPSSSSTWPWPGPPAAGTGHGPHPEPVVARPGRRRRPSGSAVRPRRRGSAPSARWPPRPSCWAAPAVCSRWPPQYAKDRIQFGVPIGSFQAVKHRCADMLVDVEGMRSATWYAAWAARPASRDGSWPPRPPRCGAPTPPSGSWPRACRSTGGSGSPGSTTSTSSSSGPSSPSSTSATPPTTATALAAGLRASVLAGDGRDVKTMDAGAVTTPPIGDAPALGQAALPAESAAALLRRNAADPDLGGRPAIRFEDRVVTPCRVLPGVVSLGQPLPDPAASRPSAPRGGPPRQHPRVPLRLRRRRPRRCHRRRGQPHPQRRATCSTTSATPTAAW